jgi:hypothetical protein
MRKPPGDLGKSPGEQAWMIGGGPRLQGVMKRRRFRRHDPRRTQGRRLFKVAIRFRVRTPAVANWQRAYCIAFAKGASTSIVTVHAYDGGGPGNRAH